ncbi:MAG: hypothetical protein SFH39_15320 [Candidatus Magnetobacterium sp. LHC-1]|uniref:Periplasmic heavy metal sensor n=1 Tax=Candidatus Magnetobacterium casense TaxID=1455061 RepID=A0ABS6RWW7_9BACT|nr:hypothetical protein [Candidatus Magnetobacterium casensis]MBF0606676.1 hypothetical protein [Nitrospirota bacterium]MBV6340293.1 hypothetical protein [Candidatus Magnetobacterium casensis]
MKKWKFATALALVFVSGLLTGAVLTGLYIKHSMVKVIHGGPPAIKKVIVKRLDEKLNLTQQQRVEVERIVAQTQGEILKLRQKNQPEIERIIESGIANMKASLTPEQQKTLEAMYKTIREKWHINE